MRSLNNECFNVKEALDKRELDVKLVVNGIEIEPLWFNSIMTKLEEHIDAEAKLLFEEHLEHIQETLETKTKKLLDDMQDIHDDLICGYKHFKKG